MSMPDLSDLERIYDEEYFFTQSESSARSAAVVVPLVVKYFPWITSVVDVGCGTGAWLLEFELRGVTRVLGFDAAKVDSHLLEIDAAQLRRVDLRKTFFSSERFDLALCLEVADCLPEPDAEPFVRQLTQFSDLIVFGAAGPGRSTRSNVNEQWPSYWISLFAARGFRCFDILRDVFWYDQRVSWWYAQDTLIFARASREDLIAQLQSIVRSADRAFDIVHPRCYESYRKESDAAVAEELFYPFRLVEEGFRGCNILQIGTSKYLGLGQREGAYSPEKLLAGGYKEAYVGGSIEEVKVKISTASKDNNSVTF